MDITNSVELGAIVRRQRKIHGLSQTELAQLLGTTRQWLSRFEQGSNDVSLGTAFAALEALDITLRYGEPAVPSAESSLEPVEWASPEAPNGFGVGEPVDPSSASSSAFAVDTQGHDVETPDTAVSEKLEAVSPVLPAGPVSRFDKLRERDSLSGLSSRLNKATEPSMTPVPQGEEEFEPVPVRVGRPAHYSIDDDIARIAKSTLFKR